MKAGSSLLLAVLAMSVRAYAGAIDFTPIEGTRVQEGIAFPQLFFTDGPRRISYEPPKRWTRSGGGSRIKFIPPNFDQAQGEIEQSPLAAPENFTDETTKVLQQRALASVAPDSQNVTVVSEEKNPLMLNGHETYEVTIDYDSFGRGYRLSVLYLNLADNQLRFRCVARRGDFEKVHKAFRGSLFSWQWH